MISSHSIRILGRELQVKSGSSPEQVARIEALVNEKFAEAAAATSGGDSQVVAILAMMNIAEAFLALKSEVSRERSSNRARVEGLLAKIGRQAD